MKPTTPNFLLILPKLGFRAIVAILATFTLASCAEYPIALKVEGEHGSYSYSAKSGLAIAIRAASIQADK